MYKKSTPEENEQTLQFLVQLKESSLEELKMLKLNLSFGGPEWQKIAVNRMIEKLCKNM